MQAIGGTRLHEHINEEDRQHLEAFPRERKATLMQRIAARDPDKSVQFDAMHDIEKTLLRLREDGFRLIDLQQQETTFSSLWYRKSDGVTGWRRAEVAMVVWALDEETPATSVLTWWL